MIGALLDPVRAQKKELPVRSSLRVQFSTWIVPYEIFCASASSDKGKCLCLLFCNLGKSISRIAALCSRSCPVSRSIAAGRLLVWIALCVIRCASRIRSIAVLGLSVTVLRYVPLWNICSSLSAPCISILVLWCGACRCIIAGRSTGCLWIAALCRCRVSALLIGNRSSSGLSVAVLRNASGYTGIGPVFIVISQGRKLPVFDNHAGTGVRFSLVFPLLMNEGMQLQISNDNQSGAFFNTCFHQAVCQK